MVSAYECKETEGIITEEPLQIGQTFDGPSIVDFEFEKIQEKINELHAQNADEKTIKFSMKKFGIERFVS